MVRERPCRLSPSWLTCFSPVDTRQDPFFWYATRSMPKLCFKFPFLQSFSNWANNVFLLPLLLHLVKRNSEFFYDIALQLLDISLLSMS